MVHEDVHASARRAAPFQVYNTMTLHNMKLKSKDDFCDFLLLTRYLGTNTQCPSVSAAHTIPDYTLLYPSVEVSNWSSLATTQPRPLHRRFLMVQIALQVALLQTSNSQSFVRVPCKFGEKRLVFTWSRCPNLKPF